MKRNAFILLTLLSGLEGLWAQVPTPTPQPCKVLIYYETNDPSYSTDPMNFVTSVLQAVGAQVTAIAVNNVGYCPTADNWGNYNEVWDLRFDLGTAGPCPVLTKGWDYFDTCWQNQAVTYLAAGGGLYLGGEYSSWNSRDQGISDLLITIGGVQSAYTECPGPNGDGLANVGYDLPSTLPGQAAPASLFTSGDGGIPPALLNGTSFVTDSTTTDWGDSVPRSVVSGWKASLGQMANLTGSGDLMVAWDMTFLTAGINNGPNSAGTTTFLQAAYTYLGGGACGQAGPVTTFTPTNTATPTPTGTPTFTVTPTNTLIPTFTPTSTPTPTPVCVPHVFPDPYNPDRAVSGWLNFDCLSADTTVSIYTVSGEKVADLHAQGGLAQWRGDNQNNSPAAPGIYFYIVKSPGQTPTRGKFLLMR